MTFRGAVVSVGGSPDPVIFSLNQHQPAFVLFLVSEASAATIEKVLPELGYVAQYELLRIRNENDLAESYKELRQAIPHWLRQRGLAPEAVYVDITGGTKPMSAALAMAGGEVFGHFSYIGGTLRDKGGLGTVASGTETPLVLENPLDRLATRERERSRWLFSECHADAAHQLLLQAAEKCGASLRERLRTFGHLTCLFADSDRFQFSNLRHQFGRISGQLELIFCEDFTALESIHALVEHWRTVEQEANCEGECAATLRELMANARRRAKQDRYDDAIARLYRATELFVQAELHKAFQARLGRATLENVPAQHRDEFQRRFRAEDGVYRLGIKEGFAALRLSPHVEQHGIAAGYEALKSHLEKRNSSILAHGLRPASKDDFESFWHAVLPVLGVMENTLPHWPSLEF